MVSVPCNVVTMRGWCSGGNIDARQDRSGGMRHSVMNMQHVELALSADIGHFDRQRQRVIGIFEQSIIVHIDSMKVQSRHILRQAKGPLVAEKMHFMAAPSEFFPERRCQHAAAANRRITGNANIQSAWIGHAKSG